MNCCDDYGNCNQGRDCPARVAKIGQRMLMAEPLPPSMWHYRLKAFAKWLLAGIFGLLIWIPLIYLVFRT